MVYMKGFGELALRLTWNLPNELMGLAAGYGAIQIGGAITEMWENVQMVSIKDVDWAFTMGSKVIGSSFSTDPKMRKHEEGHYYQSLILGPMYLPIVGVPSVVHYMNIAPNYSANFFLKEKKNTINFKRIE